MLQHGAWYRRGAGDLLLFAIGAGLLVWLVYFGAASMGYNWQWYRVPRYVYRIVDGELILGP